MAAFDRSDKADEDFEKLGKSCTETDALSLETLYGHRRREETIPHTVEDELERLQSFLDDEGMSDISMPEMTQIVDHVWDFVPDVRHFAKYLEEEQERELEAELQEERENFPVGPAEPHRPEWSEEVWRFICNATDRADAVVPMVTALKRTTLWPYVQADAWNPKMFATENFITTVEAECDDDTLGQFLRPVNWVVATPETGNLLLVSPFEANILIPRLRKNNHRSVKVLQSCKPAAVRRHFKKSGAVIQKTFEVQNHGLVVGLLGKTGSKKGSATLLMYAAQIRRGLPSLLERMTLAIPSQTLSIAHPLQELSSLGPQLAVFAGSLYFEGWQEQEAYCQTVGYVPRPRSELHQQAFDDGTMDKHGFVPVLQRTLCDLPPTSLRFHRNPGKLIRGIAEVRHVEFPITCDVNQIVFNSKKPIESPLIRLS